MIEWAPAQERQDAAWPRRATCVSGAAVFFADAECQSQCVLRWREMHHSERECTKDSRRLRADSSGERFYELVNEIGAAHMTS